MPDNYGRNNAAPLTQPILLDITLTIGPYSEHLHQCQITFTAPTAQAAAFATLQVITALANANANLALLHRVQTPD